MLTKDQFRKIEKWTPLGAKIVVAIIFLVVFALSSYLVVEFLYGVNDSIEGNQEQSLTSSLKSEKYLRLEELFQEREKKRKEAALPPAEDSFKKDPFNLP